MCTSSRKTHNIEEEKNSVHGAPASFPVVRINTMTRNNLERKRVSLVYKL